MPQVQLTPEEYARLVEELMKDEPDQKLIRQLMNKQGIPYSKDPIIQMSSVLQSLDQKPGKTKDSSFT